MGPKWIDLRSDTVTHPTMEMRKAMCEAEVGDDVYGDDPTVNRLEEMAAQIMGKEGSLFVPSGTFGNQLCIFTHTRRGEEVLIPEANHILWHEVGAASVIAGVQLRTLCAPTGKIDLAEIAGKVRDDDIHYPKTGLICMENAHSSGCAVPLENMREVHALAKSKDIPLHLDGARIFNAAVALHSTARDLTACCDSVMFCLSKGLCAPVGSMVAGTGDFIRRARKNRKLMGGGLRQAGILAAAGIIALEKMVDRLAVDHEHARTLADYLEEIDGVRVCRDRLDINMVFFRIDRPGFAATELVLALKERGILVNPPENGEFRLVTHFWIKRESLDKVAKAIRDALR